MRRALLDVNVLLALADPDHVEHEASHRWMQHSPVGGWATCALTENGFVRILSQPTYPNPLPPARAIAVLAQAVAETDHAFWDADVSILDPQAVDPDCVHGPRQITAVHLLALAVAHNGRLVTFDRSIPLSAISGASSASSCSSEPERLTRIRRPPQAT